MTFKRTIPLVDLGWQNRRIKDELLRQFSEIIDRSAFTLGDEVTEFEESFAKFCRVRHVVGVSNGTDALVLALRALDVGPGDEVITAANTFVATAEAIIHAGATPVLVDIDPTSYTISVAEVERSITVKTRAIIPVHLYGRPAEMDPIIALARKHNLYVIEDAAQAQGATYRGQSVGSIGDVGCFSFYPAKNLGAFGDAGAVVTNNEITAQRVQELRDHGGTGHYQHSKIGYTARLDSIQAAVLTTKLRYLDRWNEMRNCTARLYDELLSQEEDVVLPELPKGSTTHVFHLYVIRLASSDRDRLRAFLQCKGISTGLHYPVPVHLTPAFAHLGYQEGNSPVVELYSRQILTLPLYPGMEPNQVTYVAQNIKDFLQNTHGKGKE